MVVLIDFGGNEFYSDGKALFGATFAPSYLY